MNKTEHIKKLIEQNNGYLFVADACELGISRTYISRFIKENNMEKAAYGIYTTEDTWPDDLFILQSRYKEIVFSGEAALYLNRMTDREYSEIAVSVPKGFSSTRLRNEGILVHQEKEDTYEMGVVEIVTDLGNRVRIYDRERCICDLIKNRGKTEVQIFQTALKSYMRSSDRDLTKLARYADRLNIRDEVMRYVEVMV